MKKFEDRVEDRQKLKEKADKKPTKMSRSFLYSIYLHIALIIFVFFSFNLHHKNEIDKKEKVVINFVINTKSAESLNQPPRQAQAVPPPPMPEPEIKKEPSIIPEKPKKEEKKKDDKKAKPKPEKKPEKKEVKKPKKEEPKKEEPKKEEPKKEEKKPEEPKKEEPPVQPKEEEQPSFTENTIDKLDLLVREKFNIQSQIVGCYKRAIEQFGGKSTETINVHIELDKDGAMDEDGMVFKDYSRYNNPGEIEYRKGVDIVKQTLTFCSPLRNLPEDKYNIWKEIDMQFDGKI